MWLHFFFYKKLLYKKLLCDKEIIFEKLQYVK